jgi:HEPN domain-containing protein
MPADDVKLWLEKADEDERTVAILKAAGGPWSVAAYHVQQAAEKHIKAALVAAGIAPPKTHDLQQLVSLYPGAPASPAVETAAAMTSAYAWLTRYPGASALDETHVVQAERHLAELKGWSKAVIRSSTVTDP